MIFQQYIEFEAKAEDSLTKEMNIVQFHDQKNNKYYFFIQEVLEINTNKLDQLILNPQVPASFHRIIPVQGQSSQYGGQNKLNIRINENHSCKCKSVKVKNNYMLTL